MSLKLKLDAAGHVVVSNGHPVYVNDLGVEKVMDIGAMEGRLNDTEKALNRERLGRQFDGSRYIAENLNIPPEMALSSFGDRFRYQDGKYVAYDGDVPIYSRTRFGELANIDEALDAIVSKYDGRDKIMKHPLLRQNGDAGRQSPGAPPRGVHAGGAKVIKRDAFMQMRPHDQMAHMKAGGTIED